MNKRILVVNSQAYNVKKAYNLLRKSFELVETTDCDAAIEYLIRDYSSLDLILVNAEDLQANQYRIGALMERNTAIGPIPLICVSEDNYESDAVRHEAETEALEHGALDFILLPCCPDVLISRIKRIINFCESTNARRVSKTSHSLDMFNKAGQKGTFWNSESLEALIMRTYVGAACVLETMDNRIFLLRANDKFANEIVGRKSESEINYNVNIAEKIDGTSLLQLRQAMDKSFDTNEDASCELLLQNLHDDSSVEHVCVKLKIIDSIKERRLFYCTIRNDTKRYEAQRRERAVNEQLQTIINNVDGGVAAVVYKNDTFEYLYANNQYFSLFGYTREEFLAELPNGIFDLVLPEYLPSMEVHQRNYSQSMNTFITDFRARKRDGSIIWARSRVTPCHLQVVKELVYILVIVDITAEITTKERIPTINRKLSESDVYIHIDITNNRIVEFNSKYALADSTATVKGKGKTYEKKMLEAIYEEDRVSFSNTWSFESLAKRYEDGETKIVEEYRRYFSDGTIRWVRATAMLMEGIEPGSVNAFIFVKDIDTEKKRSIALNLVADTDIDGVAVINIETEDSIMIKTKSASIYDDSDVYKKYGFAESVKRFIELAVAEEDRIRCQNFFTLQNILKRVEEHGYADISFWLVLPEGETRRINTRFSYMDGTGKDLVMIVRNITELFKKEEEQKLQLQQAVVMADEANKAKSDFLARMSHDFRTPLSAMLGLAELAENESNQNTTQEYLKEIVLSGQYLLGLVNDTLDLSKIESGKMVLNRVPYSMDEFIESINAVIKPLYDANKTTLKINLESSINSIVVDKLRFTQIFFNLLSNAAKYTPEGGCVELTMESIPGIDNRVGMRFHIKDNGIGMSKEFQKVIFDPFTMENRPELSERKGSGLGLAIVKRIVDETGGKISIISEIGKGTEFIVDLYIYTESTTKQVESTPQYDLEVLKGIRVLVADDEPINAMILTKLLESKGCEVDRVSNGLEGVTAIQSSKPGYYDIILTDVRMPTMDGLEETRKIRALDRPDASLIPIIGTTADAYSEEEDKTKAAGMNTILVKPIDSKMLFDTVAKLVSQKQTM